MLLHALPGKNKKRKAYANNDRDKIKEVQKSLKSEIIENKRMYRDKINDHFKKNNQRTSTPSYNGPLW